MGVVTAKEDLKTVKGRNGDMKVFNFTLTDKEGDSIRIASFSETAEKFFPVIQLKNVCCWIVCETSIRPTSSVVAKFALPTRDSTLLDTTMSSLSAAKARFCWKYWETIEHRFRIVWRRQ